MTVSSLPAPTQDLAAAILGVWNLESRNDVDAAGVQRIDPILGADPLGILCFSSGHFAAQLMKRDRAAPREILRPVQGRNNSSAIDGYDAYFGTYQLNVLAGTLTIHLQGSISPSNVGSTFVRDIRVIDSILVIRLATTAADGTPVTRRLSFSRLP